MGARAQPVKKLNEKQRELVEKNMKLVYSVYHSLRRSFLVYNEREDLISEGYLGLTCAASNFKSEFGYEFSTYAIPAIKRRMFFYLRKNGPCYGNLRGDEPVSFDDNDKDSYTFFDLMEDTSFLMDETEDSIDVDSLFSILKENERNALKKYCLGYTYKDIAKELGKTKNEISSAISSGRRKLKQYLKRMEEKRR